jgi:hypothetical protein
LSSNSSRRAWWARLQVRGIFCATQTPFSWRERSGSFPGDSSVAPAEAPARAKAALDNYQADIRVPRSLAQAHNFKVLVFW